jgi:hypothetical protein
MNINVGDEVRIIEQDHPLGYWKGLTGQVLSINLSDLYPLRVYCPSRPDVPQGMLLHFHEVELIGKQQSIGEQLMLFP